MMTDSKTTIKGLQWSFPNIEVLAFIQDEEELKEGDEDEMFNEADYFAKRQADFIIEFKKEPPKSSS